MLLQVQDAPEQTHSFGSLPWPYCDPLFFVSASISIIDRSHCQRITMEGKFYTRLPSGESEDSFTFAEHDRRRNIRFSQRPLFHSIIYILLIISNLGTLGMWYRTAPPKQDADCIRPYLTYCLLSLLSITYSMLVANEDIQHPQKRPERFDMRRRDSQRTLIAISTPVRREQRTMKSGHGFLSVGDLVEVVLEYVLRCFSNRDQSHKRRPRSNRRTFNPARRWIWIHCRAIRLPRASLQRKFPPSSKSLPYQHLQVNKPSLPYALSVLQKRIRRHRYLDYYYPNMTSLQRYRENLHFGKAPSFLPFFTPLIRTPNLPKRKNTIIFPLPLPKQKKHQFSQTNSLPQDHCLEYWREAAMCRGDMSLATFWWRDDEPVSRVYSDRECVNWDTLDTYARSVMVNMTDRAILDHGADVPFHNDPVNQGFGDPAFGPG